MRRIAISCLKCGHHSTMPEAGLEQMGFSADESLVKVTKRLVCSRCHSKAVQAFRYIDDEIQPMFPVAPE
jgi:hypothetical protein